MKPPAGQKKTVSDPEAIIRTVIDACADCDTCRFLMNEDCLFFPALYRLVDQEADSGRPFLGQDVKTLTDLCTLCGLCPCPNIRTQIVEAKIAYARQKGLPFGSRLLADLQRLGHACSMVPALVKASLSIRPVQGMIKQLAGIHPERCLPSLPESNFFAWAKARGLCNDPGKGSGVAYFAGCTAGYLFPEVARAAVAVLGHNGIDVYVPPQQCCGMPTLVEGDDRTTLNRAQSNQTALLSAIQMGYQPIGSCPTCGFLMKVLLKEGAYHSVSYQASVGSGVDEIKIPSEAASGRFRMLKKSVYGNVLKDDGLFNALDPLSRIALADGFKDIGEFLSGLLGDRRLSTRFHKIEQKMAYFAPCHQREQKIGSPYLGLLSMIPGLSIEAVGGAMDCCGMGGSLGFKKGFRDASVSLGASIAAKIRATEPDVVVTDCLSCRLQFQHLLPYPVMHPLEVLLQGYQM